MNEQSYSETTSSPTATRGKAPHPSSRRGREAPNRALYKKQRGQAAVLIALSLLALVAIVGLAIDGGAAYAQRRQAQNSSDAAALAATRAMLDAYMEVATENPDLESFDGSPETDILVIRGALNDYATRHGIDSNTLEAYYVDDNKRVIAGDDGNLLQVGDFGLVPWSRGAKGVWVKNRAETNTFFMNVFGWTKIGANANSTAFMGPAVDTGSDLGMLPIGFFTNTNELGDLVIGRTYTLIQGDSRRGDGNWGYIDYNSASGSGARVVNEAWLNCGFNATATTAARWNEWAASNGCLDDYPADTHRDNQSNPNTGLCFDRGARLPLRRRWPNRLEGFG